MNVQNPSNTSPKKPPLFQAEQIKEELSLTKIIEQEEKNNEQTKKLIAKYQESNICQMSQDSSDIVISLKKGCKKNIKNRGKQYAEQYIGEQQQFYPNNTNRVTNSFPHLQSTLDKLDKNNTKMVSSSFTHTLKQDQDRKKSTIAQIEIQQDCKICKGRNWTRTKLILQEFKMSFFQFSFGIKDLEKIKILPIGSQSNKPQNAIKMVVSSKVVLISLLCSKKINQLPLPYYVFAKLIDKKMQETAFSPKSQDYKQDKLQNSITDDSYIYGSILKKSQSLGKWQQRFIVIKKNGIYSYHSSNEKSHTFYINSQSIKYLWTRFNFINDYLIIKVKYGMLKTQFGIPVGKICNRLGKNWLFNFYRVIPVPVVVPNLQ